MGEERESRVEKLKTRNQTRKMIRKEEEGGRREDGNDGETSKRKQDCEMRNQWDEGTKIRKTSPVPVRAVTGARMRRYATPTQIGW